MSRTSKGTKPPGYEWWSNRPGNGGFGGTGGSAYGKRLTHKAERQQGKKETKDQP